MSTQTGSISFESTNNFSQVVKQNYATLSQIKGQFATCGTGASTAAKVANIVPTNSNWTLYEGATVTVKFTSKNTTAAPTLNVNGTGAKAIKDYNGNALDSDAYNWPEGAAMSFTYDGTSWRLQDSDLMERVHTAETSIEQNATNIALKANSSDVYNKAGVDDLIAQEVTDRNAAIKVASDAITETVEEIQESLESKADGSTVSSLSSKVNTIEETVDGHTQTISSVQSTLNTKADSSTVSTLQSDYATYKQTATENLSTLSSTVQSIDGRVDAAESAISQHSTDINLKVSKNDVINQINVSTEDITIDADRVNIEGAAIFTSGGAYNTATTVVSTQTQWYSSTGTGSKAGGSWGTTQPAVSAGRYIWQRELVTYADGHTEYKPSEAGICTQAQTDLSNYSTTAEANNLYDAIGAANTVNNTLTNYMSTTNSTLQSLQNQVDGQIEAWFFETDPATTSYAATATPTDSAASTWTTAEIKERHIGDLYYNTTNGHSWRWMKDGNNYKWLAIPDSDAAAALAAANAAQATANSKRRIFTAQPTTPYDKGDLWVSGDNVKYCSTARANGNYNASDWVLTATDDTLAQTAKDIADAANTTANNAAPKTSAVSRTQRIYYRTNTALSSTITGPTTWITKNDNGFNTSAPTTAVTGWSTKPTPLAASTAANASKYLYLYTCMQTQTVSQAANSGTECSASTVLLDDTETIIDGGKIITGSITANQIAAHTIGADQINTSSIAISSFSDADDYATKDDLEEVSSGAEITKSMSGERTIITEDAADLPLLTLSPVVGESIQDGTPTPSAPIYIQAVRGKNLLPLPTWSEIAACPKTSSYYNYPIQLTPNTTYHINTQWTDVALAKQCGYILIANSTGNTNWKSIAHASSGYSNANITTDSTGILYFNVYATQAQYETMLANAKPQLELGTTATDYIPYSQLAIVSESNGSTLDTIYLDLKGHELHGLDNTYYDQLDIDANGHAVITKRTGTAGPKEFIIYSTPSDGTRCRSSRTLAKPPATNTTVPIIKSNMHVPLQFSGSFISGKVGIVPSGRTDYGGAGTLFIGMPTSVTTKQELLDNYSSLNVVYPLPESFWHTIDLGYVDLPQITDGSAVHVTAEIQPVISGTWWTKAGESVGQLAQQNKSNQGTLEAPYSEVEWVESNGKQYVYLDWKPKIATWGFEADFIIRNTFDTTQAAWNAATNKDHAGALFGTQNSSQNNDIQVLSYTTTGYCRIGGTAGGSASSYDAKWKKDQSRQTMKLHGTTLTRCDGSTLAVTRSSEVANKPYANMTVFAYHSGLRKAGSGTVSYPGTVRLYSLKFYDSDTLECDLVGAIRKRDGITGLYDKIAGKFYPAPGMTYGEIKNDLGKPQDAFNSIKALSPQLSAYNDTNTRMLNVNAPMLDKLEDGQVINLTYLYAIGASYQTTELAGWDDTGNNNYVYIKLTLSDGSTTEWIPCYYNGVTRLTTHYYAGYPLTLTYRENVFIGATATAAGSHIMRGFWVDPEYYSDTQYDKFSDSVIAGKNGIKRYTLCMKDDVGNWTSIVNQANNTAVSGKTCYTGGLQLGKILYAVSGAEYAAGANSGVMAQTYPGFDFRYSVNGVQNAAATELQFRKPIYLVGELDEDTGLFYLDTTKWWTQTEPTAEDGKTYILMGSAYGSYYAAFLAAKNPIYKFINGKFQNLEDLAVQETHKIYYRTTAASNKPSAGPSTWVTTATNVYNTWTTKVPPLASSTDSSTSGYTKYPFLYTCEQRRLANSTIECTDVTLDENTTIIDGGSIITNSITASQIAANAVTANKISVDNLAAINSNLGTLTAGTIDASKVTVKNIDATKITVNKIQSDQINVSSINIGDLSGEIGGRNLLKGSLMLSTKAGEYGWTSNGHGDPELVIEDGYKCIHLKASPTGTAVPSVTTRQRINLEWNKEYRAAAYLKFDKEWKIASYSTPLHFWVGSSDTIDEFSRSVSGGVSVSIISPSVGTIIPSGSWQKITIKVTTSQTPPDSTKPYPAFVPFIYGSVRTVSETVEVNMWLREYMFEEATTPSTWTPAPEDVEDAIDDASQIASNYIHADSTGINIYDSSLANASKYYLRQTAGGTYIYRNSYLKAKYEDTITLYGGNNASGANPKVELTSTDFKMTDSGGVQRLLLNSSSGAIIGKPDKGRVQVTDTSIMIYDTNSKARSVINASGLDVKDTDGSTSVALFAASSRIGKAASGHVIVDSTGMTIYDTNNKKRTTVNASGLTVYDASATPVDIANFGSTVGTSGTTAYARIGLANSSRFEVTPTSLRAYTSTSTTPFFEVTSTSLKYGTNTAETTAGAQSKADEAAGTATNYIADIDSNKGITVKPSDSSGNDYLQMNSTDIRFVRNNIDVMNLTDSSFRIGSASGYHSTINTSGLHIWSGAESTATNEVANFGTTARIGKIDDLHMNLSNGGIRLYEKEETPYADASAAKFTINESVIGNVTDIHSKISSDGFQLLVGEDKLFSIDTAQVMTTHSQNDNWEVKSFIFDEVFGEGTITTSTNGYITSNGNVHDSGQGDGWCWIASSILRAKPQLFFDIAEQTYDTQREWVPVEELIDNEFLTYEYTEPEVYGTSDTYRFYFKVSNIDTEYLPLRWKMGIGHYNYDLNIQVGRENESHMKLDYHSLQMIDKDGETYFHVSDLRDAEGRITDVFEGDGSTTVFTTSIPFNGSPIVKVNGTTFTNYTIDSVIVNRLIFGTAPANGSEITIKYEPTMNHTKAYTLGKRDESAYVGLYSVAEGYNVAVSGLYSHAEGYNTKARFAYSHAEGYYTEATASSTHAEGYRTIASGEYSHASGYRTKASSKSQTVIGEYNVEDYAQIHQSGKYAFIIGNGTADNARSNALAVDWNGGIYSQAMAGVIQMFAGSIAPSGWLVCDGSAVSRTTYATLFAAIGTTWGTGDGSTTFNLPDLRGRAPIGAGTGSGLTARTLGSTGGSEALQSHDHAAASNGYNVPGKDGGWNWRNTASGSNTNYKNTPMGGSTAGVASITRTGSTGGGNAGNMQPFAVINFIICTGKTS